MAGEKRGRDGTDAVFVSKKYGLVALAFLHIAVSRGLHGTFGVFFGAWFGGFPYVTHTYTIAFWVSLACLIVSVFIVLASSKVVEAQKNMKGIEP